MMKKILGGTVVASALLLASCGYTPEEQKFYDACVKVGESKSAKLALSLIKSKFKATGDDAKSLCANIITETNKEAKAKNADPEQLKEVWEANGIILNGISKLIP